jgi:selenocysteine lyase/cysteine desulfurase
VALVPISGASYVTRYINDIHRLAQTAHCSVQQIAVDCAQLAPHRAIDMRSLDDPSHLDYVALSAHKLYAPFGTGALVGRRDTFEQGDPDLRGGGEVEIVTVDQVYWSEPPERDEAGSPNTVGAVAMAAALRQLQEVGMQAVAEHEAALTAYTLYHLNRIPEIRIFGSRDPQQAPQRLGVIPFEIEGVSHFLAAAILGYEFGIGVRNGCFCAHPYLLHLFGLQAEEEAQVRGRIIAGDRTQMPGLVRISFGLYNQPADVDALVEALQKIARREWRGTYVQDQASGEFHPTGYRIDFEDYFNI